MMWLGWVVAAVTAIALGIVSVLLQQRIARFHSERAIADQQFQARVDQALEDVQRRRAELEDLASLQRGELDQVRADQERRETRLREREDHLAADTARLLERSERVDQQRIRAREERHQLEEYRLQLEGQWVQARRELERVAGLTSDQARNEVMAAAEHEARVAAAAIAREIETKAEREALERARELVVGAIQRVAAEQTAEAVATTVPLPSDDMKGRIIGREGRNIRLFEHVTGVNVIIDDTPDMVVLSSFDPVRREVAEVALKELVTDGRIHPARIEEAVARAEAATDQRVLQHATQALAEVAITDLNPELYPYLGALAYRTSYGQNVLRHMLETAHLAGVMAAELGMNVASSKRAAFLHDIGKALTQEAEGPHALVGADLLRRHGESEDIVHAVAAHHNEVAPQTVEAVLVQAADAISASRPGARKEPAHAYFQRVRELEKLAMRWPGVDKAFVMQAGHELRIMVKPDQVDDAQSRALARDVAAAVQEQLVYPGQIRVNVVRESRATATAN